ncbi:MAG: hypothetical protein ACLRMZ_18690 [Blautia marasmi]
MATKKNTAGQTSARMVMDVLKKNNAYTADSAVGYDAFKNLRLSTAVIAYTIANLMETGIIMRTEEDRYYFEEKNWNKVVHKVNFAYVILLGLPIIILLIFLGIQMLMS